MRPSDFRFNSDYLTLANIENLSFEGYISGGVMPSGEIITRTFTFSCKNIPQTITRVYIHHSEWEPTVWAIGRYGSTGWSKNGNTYTERIFVSTPTDSTIKLQVELQGPSGSSIPAHTIYVKAFRFKVPDVL